MCIASLSVGGAPARASGTFAAAGAPGPAHRHSKLPIKHRTRTRFVKDEALARALGETLLRDTIAVITELPATPATSEPPAPTPGSPRSARETAMAETAARALLAHRSIDPYLWLIQRAFDESLWKGHDPSKVERNFPVIWRIAVRRYESSSSPDPSLLRVCTPTETEDDFTCEDDDRPASIVPIPAGAAPLVASDAAIIG